MLASLLVAHTLPSYRPLQNRLRQAEVIALVKLTKQEDGSLLLKPLLSLKGSVPSVVSQAEGHSIPSQAKVGLITLSKSKSAWILQEQNREWVELQDRPLLDWAKAANRIRSTVQQLSLGADSALLKAVHDPYLGLLARRELVFRLFRRSATQLANKVLKQLRSGHYQDPDLKDALEAAILRRVVPKHKKAMQRCLSKASEACPPLR